MESALKPIQPLGDQTSSLTQPFRLTIEKGVATTTNINTVCMDKGDRTYTDRCRELTYFQNYQFYPYTNL